MGSGPSGRTRPRAPGAVPEVHVSRWSTALALLALAAVYWMLPADMRVGPNWLLVALELPVAAFLVVVRHLIVARHIILPITPRTVRTVALAALGLSTALLAVSLDSLLTTLIAGHEPNATRLLGTAAALWVSNILLFGLWYWELDRGGPHRRHRPDHPRPDFLFPQQTLPPGEVDGWCPDFMDYLFVAFTNSTAFSPTDTLPLSRRIKALMMIQALISLVIVAVLAARAVNIITG